MDFLFAWVVLALILAFGLIFVQHASFVELCSKSCDALGSGGYSADAFSCSCLGLRENGCKPVNLGNSSNRSWGGWNE